MKSLYLCLMVVTVLVIASALPNRAYACNPATAAAFNQALYNPNGFAPISFRQSCGVGIPAMGYSMGVGIPARLSVPSGYGAGFTTTGFGGATIIQSGRRNRIRGGGGFGAASLPPGTTIIQNGRRNRLR